jgi:hypothetical protein
MIHESASSLVVVDTNHTTIGNESNALDIIKHDPIYFQQFQDDLEINEKSVMDIQQPED